MGILPQAVLMPPVYMCVWEDLDQRKCIPHRRQSRIVKIEKLRAKGGPLTPYVVFPGRQALRQTLYRNLLTGTLIKKKIKFSSYAMKFRMEQFAKSYMMKGFLIYGEMRKYLLIYEEAVSHI